MPNWGGALRKKLISFFSLVSYTVAGFNCRRNAAYRCFGFFK